MIVTVKGPAGKPNVHAGHPLADNDTPISNGRFALQPTCIRLLGQSTLKFPGVHLTVGVAVAVGVDVGDGVGVGVEVRVRTALILTGGRKILAVFGKP